MIALYTDDDDDSYHHDCIVHGRTNERTNRFQSWIVILGHIEELKSNVKKEVKGKK